MFTYFYHPTTLSSMDNVLRMRMQEGAAGYGIYVMILEQLRASDTYKISADTAVIAWAIHEQDLALVERILTKYDLFEVDEDRKLSSPWLNAAMADHEAKRQKLQEAGRKSAAVKAAAAKVAATTLTGGGQPRTNNAGNVTQQTTTLNTHTINKPTPSVQVDGGSVDFLLSDEGISKIGKDKSGPADPAKAAQALPQEAGHNPDILIRRIKLYGFTSSQLLALYQITDGCRVGGAATIALLASFKHCQDTNFAPTYPYEYFVRRIKEAAELERHGEA